VRILNEKTERFKDLVVDVRNDLMLYTAVYDNKAVKEANVRKWGSNIVRDVKSGVSEIQLILWDEKVGGPIRVYSIESLKSTSTKDLVEIAPETMNLIPLHLQCVKHEIDTVTTNFPTLNKTIDGSEHSNPSKVYPQLKNASSGKLPSRHMRLAHMASNHMSFHETRNPSLFNGEYKTESLASLHDQLSNRANFHYGLSGLKNEISTALSQTLHDLERSDSFVSKSSLRQEQTLSRHRKISQNSMLSEQRMTPKTSKGSDKDKLKRFLSLSSNNFIPPPFKTAERNPDAPPIREISVVTNGPIAEISHTNGPIAEISLCGDLVKEVFPYHVVLDSDFRILQVGNSLSMLFEDIEEEEEEDSPPQPEINFIGRVVSDIFMVTGPIPMFGQWDWSVLDRMKEKTIFFESVLTDESTRKAKLKGTIIEMFPRQIMLSLLPNVKNLTELSNMDLSMGDLPLHSCQREAVLLGEHSAQERRCYWGNTVHKRGGDRHLKLDFDAVENGRDSRTSLMVRNIPNKYTQQMNRLRILESDRKQILATELNAAQWSSRSSILFASW
jgi:hypothetical protein